MELGIRASEQLLSFAWSIAFGAALGVWYGVFAALRCMIKTGRIITAVEDLFFWITSVFLFYPFFLIFTEGQVRFYALFGGAAGFLLYRKIAVKPICRLLRRIKRLFGQFFSKESKIFEKSS